MMGVSPADQGGISTLARQILDAAEGDSSLDLVYLATTSNGLPSEKIKLFFGALIGEWSALKCGCDVVHLHMANNASFVRAFIYSLLANVMHVKVVVQVHCDLERFYDKSPWPMRMMLNCLLSRAGRIIVLGDYLSPLFKRMGIADGNVRVIRNSVVVDDENPYHACAEKALFLGNVCEEKGVLDLLNAINLARKQLPSWFQLDICGRDLIGIDHEIAKRSLGDIVNYRGSVNVCDAFFDDYFLNVLPSHNEALPFALLEASAHGIPSIVTNVGSVGDVVRAGQTGWVVPARDFRALSRALTEAVLDGSRLLEMSNRVHSLIVERFSFSSYYKKLVALYEGLLD